MVNNIITKGITLCILGVALLSSNISAQSNEDAAISFGETGFTPSIRVDYGQNDNAFRRDEGELDETFVAVRPELVWRADRGVTFVTASYLGDFKASDQDELDYTDSELAGSISTIFSKRSRGSADVELSFNHLELGQDIFTRFDPAAFDQVEFARQRVGLEHVYLSLIHI